MLVNTANGRGGIPHRGTPMAQAPVAFANASRALHCCGDGDWTFFEVRKLSAAFSGEAERAQISAGGGGFGKNCFNVSFKVMTALQDLFGFNF